ncbi:MULTISPECIES: hypothetical protein [unclassified Planococcus]
MAKFSVEDKLRVVREYVEGHDSKKGMGRRFCLSPSGLKTID